MVVALPGHLLDHLIKVQPEQPILHDAAFLKSTFGVGLGRFRPHVTLILEDFTIPELEEPALLALSIVGWGYDLLWRRSDP